MLLYKLDLKDQSGQKLYETHQNLCCDNAGAAVKTMDWLAGILMAEGQANPELLLSQTQLFFKPQVFPHSSTHSWMFPC